MNCDTCGIPLTGGRDTFGDPGQTLCLAHWNDHVAMRPLRDIDKQIAEAKIALKNERDALRYGEYEDRNVQEEVKNACGAHLEYLQRERAVMLTRLGLVEVPETLHDVLERLVSF